MLSTVRRKRILLSFALCLAACGEPAGPDSVDSVSVFPLNVTLVVGNKQQFSATALDDAGSVLSGRDVAWTSGDTTIARVSATGEVTAVAPGGPVAITATIEGRSAVGQVTVIPVPIATLELLPNPAQVAVSLTTQLALVARDSAGNVLTGRTATVFSTNPAVATVSSALVVTGVTAGTTTISATAGGRTATATVNVVPGPVATLAINPHPPTVHQGATLQLTATARDASGAVVTGRPLTWATSDAGTVAVSGTGVVTGVTQGTATITATSEGKTASTTVTVVPAPVATVAISPASPTVREGATLQLTAIARDARGAVLTGRPVTWGTSNAGKVAVSSTGVVTGVAEGSATITATSEGRSGSTTVTVESVPAPVSTISISPAAPTIREGATLQLTATTRAANGAVLTGRPVTWGTSNAGKVAVSSTGVVTGVADGSATITATSEGKSASTTVSVTSVHSEVFYVTFESTASGLLVGDTARLVAVARDSLYRQLPGRVVTFSGSTDSITVSSSGFLSAIGSGSITLRATSEGRSATMDVFVSNVFPSFGRSSFACGGVQVGATCTATAGLRYYTPDSAVSGSTDGYYRIDITGSNPAIATVTQVTRNSATITGVSPGTITIAATYVGANGVTTRTRYYQTTVSQ